MKFTEQEIVVELNRLGMIPLFASEDSGLTIDLIDAAYRGGARVFEFTNRRSNAVEVFTRLIKYFGKYPDLMLGIGTIMDSATTRKFIDLGAHFIVSPIVKTDMAQVCTSTKTLWIPGCATLTEIITAKENGAVVTKVFPGSVLGPGFVSSILSVVPDLQLMITGGVVPTLENLSAWFGAGARCVGLGSQLFTEELLRTKNWTLLEQRTSETLSLISKIRQGITQ